MFSRRRKEEMIVPSDALRGRSERMRVPARHDVLGTPMEPPFPEGISSAVFGMGCFWGAERKFWEAPGVYTTAVGYAGGHTPNPTYEEVCSGLTGHAEVVLVAFDPQATSCHEASTANLLGEPRPDRRACAKAMTSERSTAQPSTIRMRARRGLPRVRVTPIRSVSPNPDSGASRPKLREAQTLPLRQTVPPAVSREESSRFLRPGRHGCQLSVGLVSAWRCRTAASICRDSRQPRRSRPFARASRCPRVSVPSGGRFGSLLVLESCPRTAPLRLIVV